MLEWWHAIRLAHRNQFDHRLAVAGDNDLLTLQCRFDQLGELALGPSKREFLTEFSKLPWFNPSVA